MRRLIVLPLTAALLVAPAGVAHSHQEPPSVTPASPSSTSAAYSGGWEALPSIPGGPRQEHSVASVKDDLYVLGGIEPSPSGGGLVTTTRVEVYDTKSHSWSEAAPLPKAMNHPNVAAVNGKIYVLGALSGGSSWRAMADCYVYDPRLDRWTGLPPMPAGTERGSAAVGVEGDFIYLAGGMRTLTPGAGGLQDTVATVSSYNTKTQQWTDLPQLPEARDHVGGALVKGTFYVLGGRDRGQINVRDTVFAFSIKNGKWEKRSPMPTPRGGVAAAAVGDHIFVFGGEGNPAPGSNSIFSETEAYDTAADSWNKLAPMPVPRHGTAAFTIKGSIYIPGGGNGAGGTPIAVSDRFTPSRSLYSNDKK